VGISYRKVVGRYFWMKPGDILVDIQASVGGRGFSVAFFVLNEKK